MIKKNSIVQWRKDALLMGDIDFRLPGQVVRIGKIRGFEVASVMWEHDFNDELPTLTRVDFLELVR